MRDAHFYANKGFMKINIKECRDAETEHGWHKNDYCCVTTVSHMIWLNLTSKIEIQHGGRQEMYEHGTVGHGSMAMVVLVS